MGRSLKSPAVCPSSPARRARDAERSRPEPTATPQQGAPPEAICADGASRALGAGERARADRTLTDALRRSLPGARAGTIASVDLFYEPGGPDAVGAGGLSAQLSGRALAVEMEAATIFTIGARAGVDV